MSISAFTRTACIFAALLFSATSADARSYTFGVQPQWSREQMQRMFAPLMDYLSRQTGHEFKLRISEDYGALLDEMGSGIVDFAKFTPYGYVLARKGQGVRILATELTNGRPYYYGLIIARKDSGITSLGDLRDRTFSYTDPNSTSGFIYPRALLVERGVDPNTFFKSAVFAGSHDLCIRGVAAGKVDAGATWDVALEDETHSAFLGVAADELTVIHKTEPIPNDAYAARPGLPDDVVRAVQKALLDLSLDKEKLRDILDWRTRIDGFVAGEDNAYDVVREKVALKDLKQRLAILPFDEKGVGFPMQSPGDMAGELLASKLFDLSRFTLIERARLDAALVEQKMQVGDVMNESTAVKLGNLVGANVLMTGSVMMLDGRIHVTSRMLETETGKILSAQHAKGESLDKVLDDVAAQIGADREVKGFVLKVATTENITVDIGSLQGLRAGDVLRVYRQGEPLFHPVTGKLLGTEELNLGEIVAVRTTPEVTFARLVAAEELLQQGFRVRTLTKEELGPRTLDHTGVIASYMKDERTKYAPWMQKYAWRVAAFATIPALWSFVNGSETQMAIYGGAAAGLWGVAGVSAIYYTATADERPMPSYLRPVKQVAVGGSF